MRGLEWVMNRGFASDGYVVTVCHEEYVFGLIDFNLDNRARRMGLHEVGVHV